MSRPSIEAVDQYTVAIQAVEQWERFLIASPVRWFALQVHTNLEGKAIDAAFEGLNATQVGDCLLYTSDAADDRPRV